MSRPDCQTAWFYPSFPHLLSSALNSWRTIRTSVRETGNQLLAFPFGSSPAESLPERSSADGRNCWDAQTGEPLWFFHDEVCLSPDEKRLLVESPSQDSVRLVEPETGNELFRWIGVTFDVESMALSPDSEWLVAGEVRKASVWARRRPEYWWGIAWLPEFWIALLSGGALLVIAARHLRARKVGAKHWQSILYQRFR